MAPDEKPKLGAPPITGREPSFDETKTPLDMVQARNEIHEKKKPTETKKPQADFLTGFRNALLGLFPSYKSPDEIRKDESIKKEKNLPLESNNGATTYINGVNGVTEESTSVALDPVANDVTKAAAAAPPPPPPASGVLVNAEKAKDVTVPKLDEPEQNVAQNVVPDPPKPASVGKDELKDVSAGYFVNKVATADSSGRGVIKAPKALDLSSFSSDKKTSQKNDASSPSSGQAKKNTDDDDESLSDDDFLDATTQQGVDGNIDVPIVTGLDDASDTSTEPETTAETSVDEVDTEAIAAATRTSSESYSQKVKETPSESRAEISSSSLPAQDADVRASTETATDGEKPMVDNSEMIYTQIKEPSRPQTTKESDDNESIADDVLLDAIKIAQQGVDGRIADLDMTGLDDDTSSETDTSSIVPESVDTTADEVDMEAIAAAARTAVESYTQKMKETSVEAKSDFTSDPPAQDANVEISTEENDKSVVDFSKMTVSQLKEELGKIGLTKQGRKVELVARLEAYWKNIDDAAPTLENATTEDEAPKEKADESSYSSMKVTELRTALSSRGLYSRGKKAELIARLEEADSVNAVFEQDVPQDLTAEPPLLDYSSMSVALLKEELMKRNLPRSGRKAALIARLEENDSAAVFPPETSSENDVPIEVTTSTEESVDQLAVAPLVMGDAVEAARNAVDALESFEDDDFDLDLIESPENPPLASSDATPIEEPVDQFTIDPLAMEDAAEAARNAVEALESFEDDDFDLDLSDIESSAEAARDSVELFESMNSNSRANGVAISSPTDPPLASSDATPIEEPVDQFTIDPLAMEDAAEAARNAVEALESFEDDDFDLDLSDIESSAEAARDSVELFESMNNNSPANGVAISSPIDPPMASSDATPIEEPVDQFANDPLAMEDAAEAARNAVEALESFEDDDFHLDLNDIKLNDWSKFSVKNLRKELANRGMSTAGSKIELIASLEAADLHMLVEAPEPTTDSGKPPFLDDIDLEDFDLAAIDEKARETIMAFEAEDEPSDEALREIENEMDMDVEIPEDILKIGTEPVPTPPPDYESLPVAQLKAELKNRGLRVTGKKVDLIARLQESD